MDYRIRYNGNPPHLFLFLFFFMFIDGQHSSKQPTKFMGIGQTTLNKLAYLFYLKVLIKGFMEILDFVTNTTSQIIIIIIINFLLKQVSVFSCVCGPMRLLMDL